MGEGTTRPPRKRQVQLLTQDPDVEAWGDLLAVPFHQTTLPRPPTAIVLLGEPHPTPCREHLAVMVFPG